MATQPIYDLPRPATCTQSLSFDSACNVETTKLTFEAARLQALNLQMEFAASKKSEGAKTALARYLNPQVSNWANAFDNKLLGKVAYTVGTGSDGTTHVATRTMGDWAKKFQKDHSCACQGGRLPHEDGDCAGRVTISVTTFREHFYRLPGVTERTMNTQPVLGRGGRQRWNDGWTKITLNMGAVVREKPILTGKRGRPELAQWTEPWNITSTSDYYTEKLEDDVAEGLTRDPMTTQRGANADNLLPSVPISVRSASSRTHEGASLENKPGREEGAASVDLQNTFIVWRAKSGDRRGEWLDFSLANRPRRAPKDATTVTLTPEEAAYLRRGWPMEKGLSPAERAARAGSRAWFLLASGDARAAEMAGEDASVAAEQQHQAEEERAEQDRVHAEYAAKTQDSGLGDTPSVDTPSEPVLSGEERRADWLKFLPGRLAADERHVIEVSYQFPSDVPLMPGQGEVTRWLTRFGVQAELQIHRHGIDLRVGDYLGEQVIAAIQK